MDGANGDKAARVGCGGLVSLPSEIGPQFMAQPFNQPAHQCPGRRPGPSPARLEPPPWMCRTACAKHHKDHLTTITTCFDAISQSSSYMCMMSFHDLILDVTLKGHNHQSVPPSISDLKSARPHTMRITCHALLHTQGISPPRSPGRTAPWL